MIFIQILKRKDASSVILAVALGLALAQFMSVVALGLSSALSTILNEGFYTKTAPLYDWRVSLFDPAMLFFLQVVTLELLARAVIGFRKLVIKLRQRK